ncbi:type I polyketide synthase [Streptomyces coffeae]|uniref:Acyltransferase domain-containing protein n=1 Tax=Streptomyces coffeae TaxID=621382 RepID=A0ABS1NPH4_9ACTN|nr:type I polyketide synthase [Streptomyces coffeae]MBL1101987.1 acyltransferase domain-containing protein [Streptomyces coffeae]
MATDQNQLVEALRKSLKETDRLRQLNKRLLANASEPLAIVGMSCRYPGGVSSPDELWELVASGRDAVSGLPTDRGWDPERIYDPTLRRPGAVSTSGGGFLDEIAEFDSEFFGISPREALAMDPQQRLLLEASWEAFEHAGIDPTSLRGSDTGVFCGVGTSDYCTAPAGSLPQIEGMQLTGGAASVSSGRISYVFGLEGPAVSVDTACSSSAVALHMATQALRAGECSMALVGGVTVMSGPFLLAEFSRQQAVSPDGRCRAYAASADGTGFSDGLGLVVLERLSDARRNGRAILGLIRGTAVNQDGASNGLTAPNGPSQERVIRQALSNAGLSPSEVDAVEGHGTGTVLGDPIEAHALLATYGRERDGDPLWLGSIKSNIGHTSMAAGVAGVIKMVMAMRHRVLPRTLHVDAPSPHIDWEAGAVALLAEAREWTAGEKPRRAAVSSFGVSGTNAHIILEEAPAEDPAGTAAEPRPMTAVPVTVSGRTAAAMRAQADRLRAHALARPDLSLADLGLSAATTRAQLEHRGVVAAADRDQLLSGLAALSLGEPSPVVVEGRATPGAKPVFVFPGQGAQWVGMAVELLNSSPVFAAEIAACGEALAEFVDWRLEDVLRGAPDAPSLERVDVVQPALFAMMVSLAALWRSCGVEPSAVVGHSQGEIAAAYVAGGLSLRDAARIVAVRSQLVRDRLAGLGGMMSVALPVERVEELIAPYQGRISVAAVNGPAVVIVAGEPQALDEVLAACERDDVRARRVKVDYASHSAQVEAIEAELREALAPVAPMSGRVPFHSTVTGGLLDTTTMDAAYWYTNLRGQVGFEPAIRALLDNGAGCFLEMSPHPVLAMAVEQTIAAHGPAHRIGVVGSLRRDEGGLARFLLSLGEAHTAGVKVDWAACFADSGARQVPLPTYAFQHKRYWLDATGLADASAVGLGRVEHPVLAAAVRVGDRDEWVFTGRVSHQGQPWIRDHALFGTVTLPGAALMELVLSAGRHVGCDLIEELSLDAPLVLAADIDATVQVTLGPADADGRREVAVYARPDTGDEQSTEAVCHARGRIAPDAEPRSARLGEWPPAAAEPMSVDALYAALAELGLDCGPVLQCAQSAWTLDGEVYAELALPDGTEPGGFAIHPALLESALHTAPRPAADKAPSVVSWSGVRLAGAPVSRARARIVPVGEGTLRLDLFDAEGALVAHIDRIVVRAADPARFGELRRGQNALFRLDWIPVTAGAAKPVRMAALGEVAGVADAHPDLTALERAVAEGAPVPRAVLAAIDAPAGETPASVRDAAARSVSLVRQWLAAESLGDATLAVVTRGAVAVADEVPDAAQAAVWGVFRTAQSEHPGRFLLVDTDADGEPDWGPLLGLGEPQLAVRAGKALAPRLAARVPGGSAERPEPLNPDGTVLITGGFAAPFAEHLVTHHGARHVVVAAPGGQADKLTAELVFLGARVRVVPCDITDRDHLAALLGSLEHPLTAVVHTAVVPGGGLLETLSDERLETALRATVDTAWHLHELTADADLSAFVVFSSFESLVGIPGQAATSAADAALAALASARRAAGLPGTALAWGFWADGRGIDATGVADPALVAQAGILPLPTELGLELFDRGLTADTPLLAPVELDPAVLREQARAGLLPAVLRGLVRVPARRATSGGTLARRLAEVPEAEREGVVLELVRTQVASVLGHDSADEVDGERAFKELGFDSVSAVELRNRLSQSTGVALPATVVFDHPTPQAVARLLLQQVDGPADTDLPATPKRRGAVDEPLAIVGIGCRYPGGVTSAEDLWQLVADGRDVIGPLPGDRGWDLERLYSPDREQVGTTYSSGGGFVAGMGDFDAEFFGISPREAIAMDPQQRLLLETSWETLEHAGIDPTSLRGTDTGVFVGITGSDYSMLVPTEYEGYRVTGTMSSVASGRIAYTLGLEGPAVSVETACSSSGVALHMAAQALRGGECSLALAGGVTFMTTPITMTEFSRQGANSPDGRCRAYAASADGTGFSDGLGLVVLERLSDARRNGRAILGLIRGTAINQDGASNGLTAPNGPSQERVIRQALANAGLAPSEVDAVEGHGTGTVLGDPIEAHALLATYGQERDGDPLWLGSIKSNIGHTSGASGVAGLIKMVMAMRHGVLPQSLHVDAPSPHIDWEAGAVELLTEAREWTSPGRPRRAGVSSFGVSGTNAHIIVEEAPAEPPAAAVETAAPATPVLLSARTEAAVRAQAERLRRHLLEHPGLSLSDLGHSQLTSRASLEHHAVLVAADREALVHELAAFAVGEVTEQTAFGRPATTAKPVFVFPGQGAQWEGMAVELLDSSPVFAAEIAACGAALAEFVDWRLEDVLRGAPDAPSLKRVDVVQPALFAVMVGLAALWRSYGVEPSAVVGHSQGEIAAAYVAGGLSLRDAARIIAVRSRIAHEQLMDTGCLASLALPVERVEQLIAPYGDRVTVAAVNGPAAVIVAGDLDSIAALLEQCDREDIRAKRVPATFASHSPHVEVARAEMLEALAPVEPRGGGVPLYSTSLGAFVDTATMDAAYWYGNLRNPVGFEPAIRALIENGAGCLLEMSPHPVLGVAMEETVAATGKARVGVVGSLRRHHGGMKRFLLSLAEAHIAGVKVNWAVCFDGSGAQRVPLPTYAFQRKRYWPSTSPATVGDPAVSGLDRVEHPVLTVGMQLADRDEWVLTGRLSHESQPWLRDHAAFGLPVAPSTTLVELALAAGRRVGAPLLDEMVFEAPLLLPDGAALQIQAIVGAPGADGRRPVAVHSRQDGDQRAESTRHCTGWLTPDTEPAVGRAGQWPPAGAEPVSVDGLYTALAGLGLDCGPALHGVRAVWRSGGEVYAELALPEGIGTADFGIHPALFESALHTGQLGFAEQDTPKLPVSWSGVRLAATGATGGRAHLTSDGDTLRLEVFGEDGALVLGVDRIAFHEVDPAHLEELRRGQSSLYRVDWAPVELGAATPVRLAALGAVAGGVADRYADLADLERAVDGGAAVPQAVLTVIDTPAGDGPAAVRGAAEAATALVRRWVDHGPSAEAVLAVATHRAVAVRDTEVPDPAQAAVWGVLRAAQSAHPGRFLVVDTDGDAAPEWGAVLGADEPQLALRAGRFLAPRLALVPVGSADRALPVDSDGTVLITGGATPPGASLARHLAAHHGVRDLLLLGEPGAAADGLVAELAELGARARVEASVPDRLAEVIGSLERPLTAVVHTGGEPEGLELAWRLHTLTERADLAAFVVFSSFSSFASFSSLGGGAAQDPAADAATEALVRARRAAGRAGTALAWGPWEGEGASPGTAELPVGRGLELFDQALAADAALLAPVQLDLGALRATARERTLPALLRGLVRLPAQREAGGGSLAQRLTGVSEADRERVVLELVTAHVAAVLGHGADDRIDVERRFKELGMDSMSAVGLRNRLSQATGLRLPVSFVFEHPTPAEIARQLLKQVGSGAPDTGAAEPAGETISLRLREAAGNGTLPEALRQLLDAADGRPVFSSSAELPDSDGRLAQLASGPGRVKIVCVPSYVYVVGSGQEQFMRLADRFEGVRDVHVCSLPGFGTELSPKSREAAVEVLEGAIRAAVGDAPFILVGYSMGGVVARSLAERLESSGAALTGVAMIDTLALDGDEVETGRAFAALLAQILTQERRAVSIDDASWLSMGAYLRLFTGLRPESVSARTLMVRAAEPLGAAAVPDGPRWEATDDHVEVAADHFALIETAAADTADAIERWIEE